MPESPATADQQRATLEAALAYAARGWPVFPCRAADSDETTTTPGGDVVPRFKRSAPLIKDGLKAASADAMQIRRWWKRHPDAMIGLPLGGATGVFALDFDPREDSASGERWELEQLKADTEALIGGALPTSACAVTPSGGVHLFFRMPAEGPPIRNRGCLPLHVDVRGEGGYVIAAPSIRQDGVYRWRRELDALTDPPPLLVEILRAPKGATVVDGRVVLPARAAPPLPPADGGARTARQSAAPAVEEARRRYGINLLSKLADELGRTREGARGETLNKVAFALGGAIAAGVLSRALVEHELAAAADRAGLTAKDGHERTADGIRRGLDAGAAKPLDLSEVDREAEERAHRNEGRGDRRGRSAAAPRASRSDAPPSSSEPGPASRAPAPPGLATDFRPSHEGGKRRRRGLRWGPVGADGRGVYDWMWTWELRAAVADALHCARLPLTDLGNAERFVRRFGRQVRWSGATGWMVWDGRRWKREGAREKAMTWAQATVRAIQREADVMAASGFEDELTGEHWATLMAVVAQHPLFADLVRPVEAAIAEMSGDEKNAEYAALRKLAWDRLRAVHRPAPAEMLQSVDPETGELVDLGPSTPGMDALIKVNRDGVATFRSSQLRAHGRASEAGGRIKAILELVPGMGQITAEAGDFDRDAMLFNVNNGTLRFHRTGDDGPWVELVPHDPANMITKLAPVNYAPAVPSPAYDAFFARVQPDADSRGFLHAWAGYNLLGDTSAQCFVILHGVQGANGKSTWETIRGDVLGDYSVSVKIETFLNMGAISSGDKPNPDLARLPGARHVRTAEPPKGKEFAEDLIKQVTGSEPMTVRHLNKEFFEFEPEFKITVACNRLPKAGDDAAFWRRVKTVPWPVTIPKAEWLDPAVLRARFRGEASGILNHFVAGALAWLRGGLPEVDAIKRATAAYRETSDALGQFLDDATVVKAGGGIASAELYDVYCAWCAYMQETAWTQKGFSKAMAARGFEKTKRSLMVWENLALIRGVDAFATMDEPRAGEKHFRRREEMGPAMAAPDGAAPPAGAAPAPPSDDAEWRWND